MIFLVRFQNPRTGRLHSLNCIAPDFEDCREKISSLYGEKLVSITWFREKNEEAMPNATHEKIEA